MRLMRLLCANVGPLLVTGTVLVLSGCADTAVQKKDDVGAWLATLPEANADYGSYPSNYQEIIKVAFAGQLKDPDSARYSNFTAPKYDQMVHLDYVMHDNVIVNAAGVKKTAIYGYSSCVSVNAKNSFGGYTGNEQYWFLIRNGQVIRTEPVQGIVYRGHRATC